LSFEILKKELKNGIIRNLYLFYGEEEYLKRWYIGEITRRVSTSAADEFNIITFEGFRPVREIIDACETMPFFSLKKVIIIKNSGYFKPSKRNPDLDDSEETEDEKTSKDDAELAKYLKNIPDYLVLIFVEKTIDRRKKIYRSIDENGLIVEFEHQKRQELSKWVTGIIRKNGMDIEPYAAEYLTEYCGNNMDLLINETDKLIRYSEKNKHITRKDIETVCSKNYEYLIFDMIDSLMSRDCSLTYEYLDDLLAFKEPVQKILSMFEKQLMNMLKIKLLDPSWLSDQQKAQKVGVSPFVFQKIRRLKDNFSVAQLKELIKQCAKYDIDVKLGKVNERTGLELLFAMSSGSDANMIDKGTPS
jgi:DNA polymerase III subunit delta